MALTMPVKYLVVTVTTSNVTDHDAFIKEQAEAQAWTDFLARTDNIGRTKGLRKCRTCKEYFPATADFWLPAASPSNKHKWHSKCRRCCDGGERRGSYGSRILRVDFEADYNKAIEAYQGLFSLAHKMFRLLAQLRPSMDGLSYHMDEITKEWKEIVK